MATILLIRHGQNDHVREGRLAGRLAGVHLNAAGREQATALADSLSGVPIKAVYSSPLERAMETAEPIATAKNLGVIPREGLLEVDIGEWSGRTLKQVRRTKLWKRVQENPSAARFPGGESFGEAQLRLAEEIQSIAGKHKSKDILVCVSHSDSIKLAAAYFLGLPLDLFQR
ncbi:MAG: histidine phosphatase family protein, partial [Anaerolineae bacterium]|nr:histidine phosphatase family protein [Anaerolineae bacterium]